MRLTVELRTRENQEEAARCLETQGAVLSQDSTKSIAGAKVNTAKAWYEMQINYSNYEKIHPNNSKHLFAEISVIRSCVKYYQCFRNSK